MFRRQHSATSNGSGSSATIPVWVLALAIVVATIFQVWLGYRATQQWRASARMVVEQRTDEVASLLLISLLKDMRGAFESVTPIQRDVAISTTPEELSETIAQTFARFPYVDSFFLWRTLKRGTDSATAFTRRDRPPIWDQTVDADYSFPVKVIPSSTVARRMALLAREHSGRNDQFVFLDAILEGVHYQLVVRSFSPEKTGGDVGRARAILGFAVDLDWVRRKYFSEFTREMEHLLGREGATALSLSIFDDGGRMITQTRADYTNAVSREKKFPLLFFDSSSVSLAALDHVDLHSWTARISAVDDPLMGAANGGARQTGILILFAALISLIGLLVIIRFLRMNIQVSNMKADFVAMVSHELKTPLASISLVGQAMSQGRFKSSQIADYGALLSKESARLIRHVENLLSISRVTDSKTLYSMTLVRIDDLVGEALSRLQTQIQEKGVTVRRETTSDTCEVICDREAMVEVLENIIDNAIKYSDKFSQIQVSSFYGSDKSVAITVKDTGHGIPPKDLPLIFNRFFRGKNAGLNGSGLGLSIARKVVRDHGGDISVVSTLGKGTAVTVILSRKQ